MTETTPLHLRYPTDALRLLVQLIRRNRRERRLTVQRLADHLEVSCSYIRRMERGDPTCAVGKVFEAAAVVGVRLFDIDEVTMAARLSENRAALELLPRSIRISRKVKDDF